MKKQENMFLEWSEICIDMFTTPTFFLLTLFSFYVVSSVWSSLVPEKDFYHIFSIIVGSLLFTTAFVVAIWIIGLIGLIFYFFFRGIYTIIEKGMKSD